MLLSRAIKDIYSVTASHIVTHVVEKIVPLNPSARVACFTDNREPSRKSCRTQSACEFSKPVSYVHSIMAIFKQLPLPLTWPPVNLAPTYSAGFSQCMLTYQGGGPHIILKARLSIRRIGGEDYFFRLREFWKILVLMDLKHIDSEVPTTTPTEPLVFPVRVSTSEEQNCQVENPTAPGITLLL